MAPRARHSPRARWPPRETTEVSRMTQYLAALAECLGPVAVTVEVVLVEAAVSVVDAAPFELGGVFVPLRDGGARARRLSLAARTKALAVDSAGFYPPVETIANATNALAARHASRPP